MTRTQIIQAIEDAAEKMGVPPSTITKRGAKASQLYRRMKAGGDCSTRVAARLMAFIDGLSSASDPK